MKKKQSLPGRLTILISLGLLTIWIISVFATTYLSWRQERLHLLESLSYNADLRAALSNHRFEAAQRDALALVKFYHLFHHLYSASTASDMQKNQHTLPDTDGCSPQEIQARDNHFIQMYGTAEKTNYFDSFIVNNRYGVSLLPPKKPPPDYVDLRKTALKELPLAIPNGNFYWGAPRYIAGMGWFVSIAATCAEGTLAGVSIKLSELLSFANPVSDRIINLWLDSKNQILPFSSLTDKQTQELQILLNSIPLKAGWQHIPGYLMLRNQLHGPGWQQIILYPTHDVIRRAFAIAFAQLPFAIAILSLLSITLFWLLQRHLARPLRDFVDIIEKTVPNPLALRLPEHRQDELGCIAHAFNTLLDTLSTEHNSLEARVAERTQDLIAAKQQAEQANKRKSRHLTTISHELRTPLSGALGALELLQMTDMTNKQSGMVETARQCTLSLLDIINNLLDFSRLESGQLALYVEQTALLPLIDQAMHTIQGPGQRKGLVLSTFVGENVPLHIETDGLRLRQILVNLLGNAVKFTEHGGINFTIKHCNNQLTFAVSDSGKGIAPTDHNAVFTPFFQSQGHIQGTGLGLTIASNLAQMMGGWLELNSTPGLGTCISFVLPLATHERPPPLDGILSAPKVLHRQLSTWGVTCQIAPADSVFCAEELCFLPGKLYALAQRKLSGNTLAEPDTVPVQPWRLTILLIDDAAVNRSIIGAMLISLGQNVITSASGADALKQGRQQRFDLVLMDIRMPDMDGLSCTNQWRHDPHNKDQDCMIIALSAHVASEEMSRCKKAGMHHFLSKPVTLGHLAHAVSMAAEHQLRRDIPLQEQHAERDMAVVTLDDPFMRNNIHRSLHALITELEQHLSNRKETIALLHTLKGCLGQAGLDVMLCSVLEMENHIHQGLPLSIEEITTLKEKLEVVLCSPCPSRRTTSD